MSRARQALLEAFEDPRAEEKSALADEILRRVLPFFSEAEDGIRDYKVTGVQTCALPIWSAQTGGGRIFLASLTRLSSSCLETSRVACNRSEERRVGKEWRSRWAAYP